MLADRNLVTSLQQHSDEVEVLLAEGADAQQLLTQLITAGARVEKFEMIEPSLHDIFIAKVTESA